MAFANQTTRQVAKDVNRLEASPHGAKTKCVTSKFCATSALKSMSRIKRNFKDFLRQLVSGKDIIERQADLAVSAVTFVTCPAGSRHPD